MRVQIRNHSQVIADAVRIIPSTVGAQGGDNAPVRGSYMLTKDQLVPQNFNLKAGDYQIVLPDGAQLDVTLCEVREHEGYLSGTFATRSRGGRVLLQRPLMAKIQVNDRRLAA